MRPTSIRTLQCITIVLARMTATTGGVPSGIPKRIIQTHQSVCNIPIRAFQTIHELFPDHEHVVLTDHDCLHALSSINATYPKLFENLKGPHRGDVCRYAALYLSGGIYIDVDLQMLVGRDDLIVAGQDLVYTCVANYRGAMYNALLATPPRHPLFLHLLERAAIHIASRPDGTPAVYGYLIRDFMAYANSITNKEITGLNKRGKVGPFYLFQEDCSEDKVTHEGCFVKHEDVRIARSKFDGSAGAFRELPRVCTSWKDTKL
eukprot:m.190454 g.190454  ORF g.190454 m.190454 type:complete len:262 (+) comp18039_c0_seq1:233-1018(+)